MILFPAVDILDNKAVRLLYGDRNNVTVYGSPVDVALKWQSLGAQFLHVVDLNGAFDGAFDNGDTIKKLVKSVTIPVQVGGGINSLERVKYYLEELGVSRVILGSVCVTNPEIVQQATQIYGNRIVCGIDVKNNKVAIKGWVKSVDITAKELCDKMKEFGVDTIVYTDILRDGALKGVNIDATVLLQEQTGLNVIASGGMSCIEDIVRLKSHNVYGAILGRAIYNDTINLSEALGVCK
ncbi:MAG: 1-(5-phosphoribosyl)-5-[(5-phosphoribosylamino)methylideneamino]imidazole-4-carboxamide isomerase [Clostridia bacterium]